MILADVGLALDIDLALASNSMALALESQKLNGKAESAESIDHRVFLKDTLVGLRQPQKSISPKYFYDEQGSALFDRICEVPEYYVTRTELQILTEAIPECVPLIGKNSLITEYGSGSGIKTQVLLDGLSAAGSLPHAYIPVEISSAFLNQSCELLRSRYPALLVDPICADFTKRFEISNERMASSAKKMVFFPGSTIGNFDPYQARALMIQTASMLGQNNAILLGVDLVKDLSVLELAYNDRQGITAQFNMNLLSRMNRELHANFDLTGFRHKAFFNVEQSRIEMHLESLKEQVVQIEDETVIFMPEETIHTECSYKYTPEAFERLASSAGYTIQKTWTDPKKYFAVYLLECSVALV